MIKELHDRDWLIEMYIERQMPITKIADMLGCNKTSVSKALKRNDIPRRKHTSKYPLLNDKEWLINSYVEKKMSIREIAEAAGTTAGNVVSHFETLGIERRTSSEGLRLKFPEGRFLEKHPNWKGGKRVTRVGYTWVYVPDHPNATGHGYVQEHRLVAEEMLGRYLESNEVVHHIDGDKKNNDPSNLMVMTRGAHFRLHFKAVRLLHLAEQRIKELEAENQRLKDQLKEYSRG